MCYGPVYQRVKDIHKSMNGWKSSLYLDSTESLDFLVPNRQWLHKCLYWKSHLNTVGSKLFITSICPRTSKYHGEATRRGWVYEAGDVDNNITISDSMLHIILSPQINKISAQYKVMFVCECCITAKLCIHVYCHYRIVIMKTEISKPECTKQNLWWNG